MEQFFNKILYTRLITAVICLPIFLLIFFKYPTLFSWLIFSILIIILIFEWPQIFKYKKKSFWLITFIYPILPFILIILLNISKFRLLLFNTFILIFSFDTGAYIIGKLFGRNKLCPKISPGKTWEGFIGGYVSVFVAISIILALNNKYFSILLILFFSLLVSVLALFGDLFESFLKRRAKIKDSGILLPGHGGFLDRFDSIMFVIIFIYVFRNLIFFFFC